MEPHIPAAMIYYKYKVSLILTCNTLTGVLHVYMNVCVEERGVQVYFFQRKLVEMAYLTLHPFISLHSL